MFEHQLECGRKLRAACVHNGLVLCQRSDNHTKGFVQFFYMKTQRNSVRFRRCWGEAQTQTKEKGMM